MKNKKLTSRLEYGVIVFAAAGVCLASGLDIHTNGAIVTPGTNGTAVIPFTVTLDGLSKTGAFTNAVVVSSPSDQCGVVLGAPTSYNTGLYLLSARVGACNVMTSSSVWKKGKTSIRIRAFSSSNATSVQGETVTSVDAL